MFDMAYELGALLNIRNNLNLTPLTLAAKLARREMFFHILNIDREVYWQLGIGPSFPIHRSVKVIDFRCAQAM